MNKFNGRVDPQFLIRVLKNEITDEEREFFNQWLESDDEHKEEFGQIALLWEKIANLPTPLSPDVNKQWEKFQNQLEEIQNQNFPIKIFKLKVLAYTKSSNAKQFSHSVRKGVFVKRVAALILISLIVYWFFNRPVPIQNSPQQSNQKYYDFVTRKGEKATIPLSDGSIVYLNADSKLTYPQYFDDKLRFLKLEGEGYFAVSSNPEKPFIVQTGDKFTFVRGTEFNIKFRNNKLSVVVTKGRVVLYNQDSSKYVDLTKGELSFANGSGFSRPIKVDTRLYTAWRDNKLSFVETQLSEIIEEIERFYNVEITCKNKKLLKKTLTGYFDSDSLDEILSKIGLALDFKFQRNGREILIF
jgi:ferric-dicitrate binding protein FerR (iron transport regulator)